MTNKVTLKRQINLVGGISYVTGGIIGSGIFISPSAVLEGCGNSVGITLCMWSLGGVVALCGSLCYAELGGRIRMSGGDYTYIKEGLGNLPAFLFAWCNIVLRPMSTCIGCMASAEYITIAIFCPGSVHPVAKTLLTIVILALITAINCCSVKLGIYYQTISTVCKVIVLLIIIVTGFVHLAQGHTEHFTNSFGAENITVLGLTKAFYAALFAYSGCDILAFGTEELQNRKRNLPLAVLLGVLITTVVYICTNVAYHSVLTNKDISSGIAVALVFSQRKLGALQWIILPTIGMFAAVAVNTNVFISSRMNYVAGRDNLFPRFLSMINVKARTPLLSILLLFVLSILIIISTDNIKSILTTYTFLRVLGTICSCVSLRWIRFKYADTDSTVKAPTIVPVVYVCVLSLVGITFVVLDSNVLFVVALLFGSGIIMYYVSKTKVINLKPIKSVNDAVVILCQRLLLCQFSTEADYTE